MLTLALCAGWTASGEAAPVAFTFTGAATQVTTAPGDPFAAGIAVGTTFSGQFTFESTSPDFIPDPTAGAFTSPLASPCGFSVTIGNFTFSNAKALGDFELVQFGLVGIYGGNWVHVLGDVQSLACSAGCDPAEHTGARAGHAGNGGIGRER